MFINSTWHVSYIKNTLKDIRFINISKVTYVKIWDYTHSMMYSPNPNIKYSKRMMQFSYIFNDTFWAKVIVGIEYNKNRNSNNCIFFYSHQKKLTEKK